MSIKATLPVSSTRTFWKSPTSDDRWPSYALNVMDEVVISREPNFYQTNFDIIHVDYPSSMMH